MALLSLLKWIKVPVKRDFHRRNPAAVQGFVYFLFPMRLSRKFLFIMFELLQPLEVSPVKKKGVWKTSAAPCKMQDQTFFFGAEIPGEFKEYFQQILARYPRRESWNDLGWKDLKSHPSPTLHHPRLLQVHPTLGYFQGCLKTQEPGQIFPPFCTFRIQEKLGSKVFQRFWACPENSKWMNLQSS